MLLTADYRLPQVAYYISDSTLPNYLVSPMELTTSADQHRSLLAQGGAYNVNGNYPPPGTQAAIQALFTQLFALPSIVSVSLELGVRAFVLDPVLEITLGPKLISPDTLGAHVGAALEVFQRQLITANG